MPTPAKKPVKKMYSTPQLNKLDFEQAVVFLVGQADNDPEALKLVEEMFPDSFLFPSA